MKNKKYIPDTENDFDKKLKNLNVKKITDSANAAYKLLTTHIYMTREDATQLQRQDLEQWRTVLKADAMSDLERYCLNCNANPATTPETTVRGNDLLQFVVSNAYAKRKQQINNPAKEL